MLEPARFTLDKPEFSARVQNLFNLMNVADFQKKFFANPALVATRELGVSVPNTAQVSSVNRMIFSLLSDPKFNEWSKTFQSGIEKEFPGLNQAKNLSDVISIAKLKANQDKFKTEFTQSIIQHLSPDSYRQIVAAGLVKPGLLNSEGDVAIVLLTFVAVIVIVVIAAGVGRPTEMLSRINVSLVVNQLSKEIQSIAVKGRQ
jgi:hypothetical protein